MDRSRRYYLGLSDDHLRADAEAQRSADPLVSAAQDLRKLAQQAAQRLGPNAMNEEEAEAVLLSALSPEALARAQRAADDSAAAAEAAAEETDAAREEAIMSELADRALADERRILGRRKRRGGDGLGREHLGAYEDESALDAGLRNSAQGSMRDKRVQGQDLATVDATGPGGMDGLAELSPSRRSGGSGSARSVGGLSYDNGSGGATLRGRRGAAAAAAAAAAAGHGGNPDDPGFAPDGHGADDDAGNTGRNVHYFGRRSEATEAERVKRERETRWRRQRALENGEISDVDEAGARFRRLNKGISAKNSGDDDDEDDDDAAEEARAAAATARGEDYGMFYSKVNPLDALKDPRLEEARLLRDAELRLKQPSRVAQMLRSWLNYVDVSKEEFDELFDEDGYPYEFDDDDYGDDDDDDDDGGFAAAVGGATNGRK